MTRKDSGFSLIEALTVLAIIGLVTAAIVKLFIPLEQYFMRSSTSQKTIMESRIAMDTITRELQLGMANSVTICSCVNPTILPPHYACADTTHCTPTTPASVAPPNSQIEFTLQGNTTSYTIFWAEHTVQMISHYSVNGNPPIDHQTTLDSNAMDLKFMQNVPSDPAVIFVTLASSATYDSTGNQGHTTGVTFNSEEVHMLAQS